MDDNTKYVVVATFSHPFEAQLARGRLEAEGIEAVLTGNLSADVFSGVGGMSDVLQLHVSEDDSARAESILAECAGYAAEPDPERPFGGDAIWVCSLCGGAVEITLPECPDCRTPRESIRAAPPEHRREEAARSSEDLQARTSADAPVKPLIDADLELPALATFQGDDLANRALKCAILSCLVPLLVLYSCWLLLQLMLYPGELSPAGMRKMYAAIFLTTVVLAFVAWSTIYLRFYYAY